MSEDPKPKREERLPAQRGTADRADPPAEDFSREVRRVDAGTPVEAQGDRLVWIEHRNTEILLLEFRGGTRADAEATLERVIEVLCSKLPDSLLFLADLRVAVFWAPVAMDWQKTQDLLASRCRRIAGFGVKGLIRTASHIFLEVAASSGNTVGKKVKLFPEAEPAKDWLIDGRESP